MSREFQRSTSCKEMSRGISPFNFLKGQYYTSYRECTAMTPALQHQLHAWQPAGLGSQQAQRTLTFNYKYRCLSMRPGVSSRQDESMCHQVLYFFLIKKSEWPPWNLLHDMDILFHSARTPSVQAWGKSSPLTWMNREFLFRVESFNRLLPAESRKYRALPVSFTQRDEWRVLPSDILQRQWESRILPFTEMNGELP